jgi:hypothetical protein
VTDGSWTVRFSFNIDLWCQSRPVEVIAGVHAWVAACREHGPPADPWLHTLEGDYRYRYRIPQIGVNVEFIAVHYERWMLIKSIS